MTMYEIVCKNCRCVFETQSARMYCPQCKPREKNRTPHVHERKVGERFGKLTVLAFEQRQGKKQLVWYVLCRCECGNEKWISWGNVTTGRTISCGCALKEIYAYSITRKRAIERANKVAEYAKAHPSATYDEIGKAFSVSRERVRQMLLMVIPAAELQNRKRNAFALRFEERLELERLRIVVRSQEQGIREGAGS